MMPQGASAITFSTHWHASASATPSSLIPYAATAACMTATSTAAEELTPLLHGTSDSMYTVAPVVTIWGISFPQQMENAQDISRPASIRSRPKERADPLAAGEKGKIEIQTIDPSLFAHLRINEHDFMVGAELHGGAGGLADGCLKNQAPGIVGIAAHQVQASGNARSEDGTIDVEVFAKAHLASSSTAEQR